MNFKKIFINFCIAIVVFALFIMFFLKPAYGPQFEIISDTKNNTATPEVELKPSVSSTPISSPTPTVSP